MEVWVSALVALSVVVWGKADSSCCLPPQWEAYINLLQGYHIPNTGMGEEMEGSDFMSYDFINKRVLNNVTMRFNQGPLVRVVTIIDDIKGLRYDIINNTCTSRNITGDFLQCLPDNASFAGTTYFGAGNNKLETKVYYSVVNNLPVISTWTTDECYPVSQTAVGEIGINGTVEAVLVTTFTGITLGIKDPKVFDPPSDCVHSNEPPPAVPVLGTFGRREKKHLDEESSRNVRSILE